MSPAISVQGLGKKYLLTHQTRERYTTLRDVLANGTKRFAGKLRHPFRVPAGSPEREEFWALRDVSFEIRQGDRVGIIGRNGAGKSTLLKLLSRITDPSTGRIQINGRVASLLEVGTGFHPELTGRENIYLNGAILGMSGAEIRRKFDEIVAFAEVERFLDTPVKRYSSGMSVRLAFAVAAHLEPEILIVDEVLAVGDAQFQRKCLGKMQEVGSEGRTVLFVSHNTAMISNLCQKGLVLDAGQTAFFGSVSAAVLNYYQRSNRAGGTAFGRNGDSEGENVALLSAELVRLGGEMDITIHDPLVVRMKYRIKKPVQGKCVPNFHFFLEDGSYAFVSNADAVAVIPPGDYVAECRIPGALFNEGAYSLGLAVTTHFDSGSYQVEFFDRCALTFNVMDPMDEYSNRYGYVGPIPGVVRPKLAWSICRDDNS